MNKKKIALFRNNEYTNSTSILDEKAEDWDGYFRASEYIDVEFQELSDIKEKEVAMIDESIRLIQVATKVKLNALIDRKQKLLALPAPE